MLQNKLLTLYFELKLRERRTKNISLTEICRLLASCYVQTLLWDVLELAVSREVVGVGPMALSMSVRLPVHVHVSFYCAKR